MKIMLDKGAKMPTRAHPWDAGLDLFAAERKIIRANDFDVVETGIPAEIPCGYVGEPEDISPAVLLLCSDEGRYITGIDLVIDGGMRL